MKAIIVADNNKVIDNISQVLEIAGYDVIVYRWLLKAIDNIEEIRPHLIIVSTKEYPRHWKTLTQFASCAFGEYRPQIILFTDGGLSYEEYEKAEALHVRGMFDSVDVKGLDELRAIIAKNDDIYSGALSDSCKATSESKSDAADNADNNSNIISDSEPEADFPSEEMSENDDASAEEEKIAADATVDNTQENTYCSILFTDPNSGALITGYAKNYTGKTVEFIPDKDDILTQLSIGQKVDSVSIHTSESVENYSAVILNNSNSIVLEINS